MDERMMMDFLENVANDYFDTANGNCIDSRIPTDISKEFKEAQIELFEKLEETKELGTEYYNELNTAICKASYEESRDSFIKGFKYALSLAHIIRA